MRSFLLNKIHYQAYNNKNEMKVVSKLFFAIAEKCEPCGLFNTEHLLLTFLTSIGIGVAVKCTTVKNKKDIKKIILFLTILLWILEIFKIIFNISVGNIKNLNTYVPLYYCSILLYACILSSFCKGILRRIGDVFIATGGIIAGIIFLIFPTSSLLLYPIWHFITVQSFVYHGVMIYLGIIVNKYHYIELKQKDIIYYALLVGIVIFISLILNVFYGSNFMFISQNYPGTPITYLYKILGKFFTPFMILVHITIPFYLMYWLNKKVIK